MKLISFYYDTDESKYFENYSIKLINRCNELNIRFDIRNQSFGNTWIDNVKAKPLFIKTMLLELKEDILFLDIDCSIIKIPDFSNNTDWAINLNTDNIPNDFVHYIKYTESNLLFLDKWITEINRNTKGSHSAFINIYKELNLSYINNDYFELGISNTESKNEYFK